MTASPIDPNDFNPLSPSNFSQLQATIAVDRTRGDWSAVSDGLKNWAATFRGKLSAAERQWLTEAGTALLLQGEVQDCRGLASVFRLAGDGAIAALHAMLVDGELEFEVRWFAGQILAQLHRLAAITMLVGELDAADEMTAAIASQTLSHFGTAEVDVLVSELHRPPAHPVPIVRALAQISDPVVIEPLLAVADHPEPAIRLLAIGALSGFDDDRAVLVLLTALRDTHAPVRRTALSSLGAKAQYQQEYGSATIAPSRPPIDWLAHFEPLIRDLNPEVANQAAMAIGRLGTTPAIAVLLKSLRSPLTPRPQAIAIVRALLQQPKAETIAALLALCGAESDHQQAITLETVRGLGRVRDSQLRAAAAAQLAAWCEAQLGDRPSESRALDTLHNAPPSHQSHKRDKSTHSNPSSQPDPTLRQAIAYSFGRLGAPVGRVWLEQLTTDSCDRVRITAQAALNSLPNPPR